VASPQSLHGNFNRMLWSRLRATSAACTHKARLLRMPDVLCIVVCIALGLDNSGISG